MIARPEASAHGLTLVTGATGFTGSHLVRSLVADGIPVRVIARSAERARDIHQLGRELHTRLATLSGHLDRVGRSLNSAVDHFNSAMGSLETRVLVSARRFNELSVTDDELPAPRPVTLRAVDRRGTVDDDGDAPTVAL